MIEFAKKTFSPGKFPNVRFRQWTRAKSNSSGIRPLFSNAAFALGGRPSGDSARRGFRFENRRRLVVSCGGKGNAQDVFLALRPEMRLKRWCEFFEKRQKPIVFHAPTIMKMVARFGFRMKA